jgi:hypothetical protein
MGFGHSLAPGLVCPSLVVVISYVIEGSFPPFLWMWSQILFLILWGSAAIRIDVVDMLQVVVVRPVLTVLRICTHGTLPR